MFKSITWSNYFAAVVILLALWYGIIVLVYYRKEVFNLISGKYKLPFKKKQQKAVIADDPMRKYKEVFISLGGMLSKVYRTEVSPEEYYAYTTEQTEKVKVAEYAARFGSIEKGIAALVADQKASIKS